MNYRKMKNKHTLLCVLFLVLGCILTSCNPRRSYSPALVKADSLIAQRHLEEAYKFLTAINSDTLSEHDRHYYGLLLTQAQYMCYIPFKSDSLINASVDYFAHSGDNHNYIRSLIYQGGVREDMGHLELAVESYHTAEKAAEGVDMVNLAYAKFRMGFLYKSQIVGAQTIALEKLKESLPLFQKIGDRHYELMALLEIGGIFRGIEGKGDSAVLFLSKAIDLAQKNEEGDLLFSSRCALAEFYADKQDYTKAKHIIREALSDKKHVVHPRGHCCAASIYMQLGALDSAKYYLEYMPAVTNRIDSVSYLKTYADYYKYKGNKELFDDYKTRSRFLAESLHINSLNAQLLAIEKKYDKKEEELKNVQLQADKSHLTSILIITLLFVILLVLWLLYYRQRLRAKQDEYETLTSDLGEALTNLQELQSVMDDKNNAASTTVQEDGKTQDNHSSTVELRAIMDEQISTIQELIVLSYELPEKKFLERFKSVMTLSQTSPSLTYWTHLQELTNELHNGIIEKAIARSSEELRDDEINFLCLYSCGYTRTGIMVCMHYTNIRTVYNKKRQIADKLGVKTLDDFIRECK